jgi:hypothetical protein
MLRDSRMHSINFPRSGERPLLVHNVALRLGVSRRTVRYHAARGILAGFKYPDTPKIWRFWRSDVEHYARWRGGQ